MNTKLTLVDKIALIVCSILAVVAVDHLSPLNLEIKHHIR